jgi:hypothetical protein
MTEAEWLASGDQRPMLAYLRGRASDRKLRLFAAACCRRVWQLITNPDWRQAVEAAELYADGAAAFERMRKLAPPGQTSHDSVEDGVKQEVRHATGTPAEWEPLWGWAGHGAVQAAAVSRGWQVAGRECPRKPASVNERMNAWGAAFQRAKKEAEAEERRAVADLLRCIFGIPFRPVKADPAWLSWNDGTAVKLARVAYDDRLLPSGHLDAFGFLVGLGGSNANDRLLPSGHLDAGRLAVLADALEEAGCSNADILAHLRGPGPHVRGCWVVDLLLGKS